ncbi:MAG: shikimate dehydrogenase [Rhodobacter sp.]|nr:shikimate dehydrogenase [Rhodobacter sp.]
MSTLRAGLIGEHISRTRLPLALDLMCGMAGWTLEFELIDIVDRSGFDFDATVDGLQTKGWTGVTVTHPWKTSAAAYAGDGMLPELRGLGASNTLVFGQPLTGHNTDFTGFIAAWEAAMDAAPGRVAMAGAGGVARALGPALARLGAGEIVIWDMDRSRAEDLAAMIGPAALVVPASEADEAIRAADGLVNATPMGMREYPGSAFDAILIGPQRWAFDAVYTPTNTEFLQDASTAGLITLSGFALFQHMAIRSFQAYTGISLDPAEVLPRLDTLKPD